ncbi:hemerythrin domain-containing protein [uncultured Shewanella sp.]|uniref:hemerythrin domain-containing protein n=1 Tax=uncultured Shewanella sp. TaxID=173975 RepID=UPI002616BC96|nr:hemerythrin domain-containing protein [uncultured Shewanella sp.]
MHPLLKELYAYHNNTSVTMDEVERLLAKLKANDSQLKDNDKLFHLLTVLHSQKESVHHQNEEVIRKRLVDNHVSLHPSILALEHAHKHFYDIANSLKTLVDSELNRQEIIAIIEDYLRQYFDHIDTEENIFFPVANKLLTDEDWKIIARQWQYA